MLLLGPVHPVVSACVWHLYLLVMRRASRPCFCDAPTTGRSEFTLVRTRADLLPVRRGLEDLVKKDGATPVLVGEMKAGGSYEVNIGQPLACALELMMISTAKPESMWWVLACYHPVSPWLA